MSEEEQDKEAQTEEPTQKKLEEAVSRGQVISSREVNNAFVLIVLTLMIVWVLPIIFKYSIMHLRLVIEHAGTISIDQGQVWNVVTSLINKSFLSLSPLFVLVIVAVIFATFAQQGQITFSADSLEPKLSKISILSGFGRIFSMKSFVEFIKNIAKVFLVGMFLYLIIKSDIQSLRIYQDMGIGLILQQFHEIIMHVMVCITITVIVIAVIDYSYQHYEYYKSLRMTKQEVKEEHKQAEGDPIIKARIRQLRKAQAKNNLNKNVPKADVIITNPTHFAVALQYDHETMPAPKLVAKGQDLIALKIREMAEELDIPIVENPPLARALYKKTDEMQYIPIEHYDAVAKIIGYVYSLKNKKKK